jgi:acetylornithine/N-succinyldiaminopimelate aminotransferase
LADGLIALSKEFSLGAVRGKGTLLALELGSDAGSKIVNAARDRGLLLNAPRPHCLRFMPALYTTPAEVDEGLTLLRQILKELQ